MRRAEPIRLLALGNVHDLWSVFSLQMLLSIAVTTCNKKLRADVHSSFFLSTSLGKTTAYSQWRYDKSGFIL